MSIKMSMNVEKCSSSAYNNSITPSPLLHLSQCGIECSLLESNEFKTCIYKKYDMVLKAIMCINSLNKLLAINVKI